MVQVLACLGCGKWAYDAKEGCTCGALSEQIVFMRKAQATAIRDRYLSLAHPVLSAYSEKQQTRDVADLFGS